MAEGGLAIPSMRAVARSQAFLRPRSLEGVDKGPFIDSLAFARSAPTIRAWNEMSAKFGWDLDLILRRRVPIEATVRASAGPMNNILGQY